MLAPQLLSLTTVRYMANKNFPQCAVYAQEGLPAMPFQMNIHKSDDETAAERPCDILKAAGNPCVAAHSTTRALYADWL